MQATIDNSSTVNTASVNQTPVNQTPVVQTPVNATSKAMLWTGRVLSAIAVLFLIFDASIHLLNLSFVVDASKLLGLPVDLAPTLGVIELICLAFYLIPRTAPLGALLLTGYLGGVIAIQMRAEQGLFPIVFALIMGALLWGGLYLQDAQLRQFVMQRR